MEPFSPDNTEANFDDIEVEPELRDSSPRPLVQAQRLEPAPSIEVVGYPTEDASDPNQECFKALRTLRTEVWVFYIRCLLRAQNMSIVGRSGAPLQIAGHP
jgi:hypothetical protein